MSRHPLVPVAHVSDLLFLGLLTSSVLTLSRAFVPENVLLVNLWLSETPVISIRLEYISFVNFSLCQ